MSEIEDLFPLDLPTGTALHVCLESYIRENLNTDVKISGNHLHVDSTPTFIEFLQSQNMSLSQNESKFILTSHTMEIIYKELWRTNDKIQRYHRAQVELHLPSVLVDLVVEYTVFGSKGSLRPSMPLPRIFH